MRKARLVSRIDRVEIRKDSLLSDEELGPACLEKRKGGSFKGFGAYLGEEGRAFPEIVTDELGALVLIFHKEKPKEPA